MQPRKRSIPELDFMDLFATTETFLTVEYLKLSFSKYLKNSKFSQENNSRMESATPKTLAIHAF